MHLHKQAAESTAYLHSSIPALRALPLRSPPPRARLLFGFLSSVSPVQLGIASQRQASSVGWPSSLVLFFRCVATFRLLCRRLFTCRSRLLPLRIASCDRLPGTAGAKPRPRERGRRLPSPIRWTASRTAPKSGVWWGGLGSDDVAQTLFGSFGMREGGATAW